MTAEEEKAKEIIKKHLGWDAPSYKLLIQDGDYGFMQYYLDHSINDKK